MKRSKPYEHTPPRLIRTSGSHPLMQTTHGPPPPPPSPPHSSPSHSLPPFPLFVPRHPSSSLISLQFSLLNSSISPLRSSTSFACLRRKFRCEFRFCSCRFWRERCQLFFLFPGRGLEFGRRLGIGVGGGWMARVGCDEEFRGIVLRRERERETYFACFFGTHYSYPASSPTISHNMAPRISRGLAVSRPVRDGRRGAQSRRRMRGWLRRSDVCA